MFNLNKAVKAGNAQASTPSEILIKSVLSIPGINPLTGTRYDSVDSWIDVSDIAECLKTPNMSVFALVNPNCSNDFYDKFIVDEIAPLGLAFASRGQATEGKKSFKFAIVLAPAKV
tara:strand:+ start:188 stop:535 length:348 start_codon:yes stop_codon:yes gene_type:complete